MSPRDLSADATRRLVSVALHELSLVQLELEQPAPDRDHVYRSLNHTIEKLAEAKAAIRK